MLLKLSKLTGDKQDRRSYINTRMVIAVGPVAGDPDKTLILMLDRSHVITEKPVEEVVETLKEHDRELAV